MSRGGEQPLAKLRESLPSFCCLEMLLFHTSLRTISSSSHGNKCPETNLTSLFLLQYNSESKTFLTSCTPAPLYQLTSYPLPGFLHYPVQMVSSKALFIKTERTLNHPRSTLITTHTAMGLLGNQNPKIKIPVFLYFLSSWVLRRLLFGCIRCKFTPSSLRCFHP